MIKHPKIISTSPKHPKISHEEVAEIFGAEPCGVRVTGNNPITLAAVRDFLHRKLRSSGGRPAIEGIEQKRNKIPMVKGDWERLSQMAAKLSQQGTIKTTPGQLVAAIIHQFLEKNLQEL